MDDVRLSDLKVGDNLINKYFLMPTNGWRIPRDIT
jgi:hypothetical protein